LQERLDNEKDYLARLRLNHAISPLDNPNKIVESRRNVARLMTELNRRSKTTGTGTESKSVESETESETESDKS